MRRQLVVLVVVCLVAAACGGRDDSFEAPPDRPSGATRALELPEPIPAIAAYRVDLREPVADSLQQSIEKIPGVAIVTAVARKTLRVRGPQGSTRLSVGSTRPLRFRSVAPASTKEAEFVWSSLLVGSAVLTFDAARDLGIEDSGIIELAGRSVTVGSFAANGTPDVADVLVADHVGRNLGFGDANVLIVGADPRADIDAIGQRLDKALAGVSVKIRRIVARDPAPLQPAGEPQPVGHAEGTAIGAMSFRILKDGFIDPDPAWEAANIATGEVAILGRVTCHRLVLPQLHAAMTEVAEEGLANEIDPADYGGCYAPRFIDRDPNKPLSMHAFGLAFDINVSTNHLGTRGDQHPGVVDIMERWGFEWGGRWARPDPMHFELVRLVQT